MIYNFQTKENCCGCTSCVLSCPTKALSMQEDEKGFLYPVINKDICVSCGLCNRVCDFNSNDHYCHGAEPISAYAVKHVNNDVRAESRSGGVFTAITDYIIENGGCVFGAAFDNGFNVHHIKCETKEQRDMLRGSKYVQSDMNSTYKDVKDELESGRIVGFSGTACQVAGLYAFLGGDHQNLITFDLVCHGVPSPKLWRDYIDNINKKHKGNIQKVNFRDKQIVGWAFHIESFIMGKHKLYKHEYTDLFRKSLSLRDSCFSCKYTNLKRPGDFTLADFWGIESHFADFNDDQGVSLLLVNSSKAESIFGIDKIQASVKSRKCKDFNFVHPNLKKAENKPDDYEEFWDEYTSKGLKYVIKKYSYVNLTTHLRTEYRYLKAFIRNKYYRNRCS